MEILPNEITLHIFSYFNPNDMVILSSLSKRFWEISNNEDFWKKFFRRKFTECNSIKSNFRENFIIFTLLEDQNWEVFRVLGLNFCGTLKTWEKLQEFKSISIVGKMLKPKYYRVLPTLVSIEIENQNKKLRIPVDDEIIKEFPLSLNFCTKLERLNFSYNEIPKIPNFISSFVFMTTLKLSHNKLTSVPSLESLKKLKNLNMSHNEIKKLPKMPNSVENLDFSFNKIIEIDVPLSENLKRLDLSYNKISEMNFHFSKLTFLNLSNNRMKKITFSHSSCLEKLNLGCNYLRTLPIMPKSLKYLL